MKISRFLKSVEFEPGASNPLKTAGIKTDKRGVIESKLIPEPIILKAIVKYKPDLAEACLAAGLRVFLHRLAGFEVITTAIVPTKSDKELLLEAQFSSG